MRLREGQEGDGRQLPGGMMMPKKLLPRARAGVRMVELLSAAGHHRAPPAPPAGGPFSSCQVAEEEEEEEEALPPETHLDFLPGAAAVERRKWQQGSTPAA